MYPFLVLHLPKLRFKFYIFIFISLRKPKGDKLRIKSYVNLLASRLEELLDSDKVDR